MKNLILGFILLNYLGLGVFSQLVNNNVDLFDKYIPIDNFDTSASDESGGKLLRSFASVSRYDCAFKCSQQSTCKMISYKLSQCKLFNETVYSLVVTLNEPVLFKKDILDFSTVSPFLTNHWPFNSNLNDIVGQSSATATYTYVTDRLNKPLSAVHLPYSNYMFPSVKINSDFSVTVWIKLLNYNPTLQQQRLLFLSGGPANLIFGLTYSSASSSLCLNNGFTWQLSTTSLALNKWQHLAYIQSGFTLRIYLNGNQVYQNTAANLVPAGTYTSNWVGNVDGHLDDLKIFNKTLSQSELLKVLNSYN